MHLSSQQRLETRTPRQLRLRARFQPEPLESRRLLSMTDLVPSDITAVSMRNTAIALAPSPTPPSGAFTPSQIKQAYGFDRITGDGSGQTIAIVDVYHDPMIRSDLDSFNAPFALPPMQPPMPGPPHGPTLTQVNQTGDDPSSLSTDPG